MLTGIKIDNNDLKVLRGLVKNFVRENLRLEVDIKKAGKLGEKTCLIELRNPEDQEKMETQLEWDIRN